MRRIVLVSDRGPAFRVLVTESRRDRVRGLLRRPALARDEGLLIPRVRSVHTFGMPHPIAAAFLDSAMRVVRVTRLPPRRIALPRRRVRHVLEVAPDADVRPGDALREAPSGGLG